MVKDPGPVNKPAQHGEVLGLDKRQLLTRHINGDQAAFGELVGIYRRQVYTYLVRAGITPGARDDLFQEIFLTVHRAAAGFDPALPFGPWLFTIVANKVRDHYRREKVARAVEEGRAVALERDTSPSGAEQYEAQETSAFLEFEIKKLPFDQREVLLLCGLKGLQQADVAIILHMPLSTVKTNLRRARIRLLEALTARKKKQSQQEVLS